jgi:hypothetical protein
MVHRAPITVDGVRVGEIICGLADEVDEMSAESFSTPSSGARMASLETGDDAQTGPGWGGSHSAPGSYGDGATGEQHPTAPHVRRMGGHHRSGVGYDQQKGHTEPDHTNEKSLPKGHRRFLDPENRARQRSTEEKGIPHFSTQDIAEKVHGKAEPTFPNITKSGGHLDRSRFEAEIKAKPWLRDKIMRIAANEEGANPVGTQAIIESMMNRAEVRGTSLEQQARWHRSQGGYYDEGSMGRGALENSHHRGILEHSLSEALAGSNVSNYATDNSSGGLAAGERSSGKFRYRSGNDRTIGDTMFSPGTAEPGLARAYDKWLARQQASAGQSGGTSSAGIDAGAKPAGVTEIANAGNGGAAAGGGVSPDAKKAWNGQDPAAFIMHHTGGGRTPADIVNTLRQRGLGVQNIMDREGVIHDVAKEFEYNNVQNIKNGWGAGKGLNNKNIVGMEVIANDNRDVNQKQVESAQRFIRENYPNTPVFGHGEVNPGHKEADEGMKITNAIRNERANSPAPTPSRTASTTTPPAVKPSPKVVHLKPGDPLPKDADGNPGAVHL